DWELARVRASPARKTTAAIASWRSSAASRESSLKAASTGRGAWATSNARNHQARDSFRRTGSACVVTAAAYATRDPLELLRPRRRHAPAELRAGTAP